MVDISSVGGAFGAAAGQSPDVRSRVQRIENEANAAAAQANSLRAKARRERHNAEQAQEKARTLDGKADEKKDESRQLRQAAAGEKNQLQRSRAPVQYNVLQQVGASSFAAVGESAPAAGSLIDEKV